MTKGERDQGAWRRLSSLWPALPFLGFGPCLAWLALLESGIWMSAVEANGDALRSLDTTVHLAMFLSLAVLLVLRNRIWDAVRSRALAIVAGSLGVIGSLLLVVSGPYYGPHVFSVLGNPKWIFTLAGVLCGTSLGVLYFKIGVRYCLLPFRYAILYLCYSHVFGVVIYLATVASPDFALIQGGPTLATIIVFVAMPLLALVLVLPSFEANMWEGLMRSSVAGRKDGRLATPSTDVAAHAPMSRRFALLYSRTACVLFLFALVCSGISAGVVGNADPALLQEEYNLIMLLRLPVLLCIAIAVVSLEAERINFSKLCLGAIILLELCAVLAMSLDPSNRVWFVTAQLVSFVFQFLVWSIVFAVGGTHRSSSATIVAAGFLSFSLGSGFGLLLGTTLNTAFPFEWVDLGFAVVLLPTLVMVGERDLDELISFGRDVSAPDTLDTALGGRIMAHRPKEKGEFSEKLAEYAAEHELTVRESEVLRYLVAGRGDRQIADEVGLSYNTVRTHVRNIYAKCGVHGRQELISVVDEYAK